ncbi:hypothetical protein C8Q73DRAFT_815593 [Cubamyces lactineus]|nr:hypothetical protein C8Q73DRAFT_815593 [Cubamyces lactineus]
MLGNDIAALIGFACETALWGMNCVLFFISLGLLYRKGRRGDLNLTIFIIHCLLFVTCTAHFGIEFNHFYTTLNSSSSVVGFANETKALLAADVFISICDLLGDAMLLYRCWVMWGDARWVIVLPVLSAVAGFICLLQVVHFVATLSPASPVPPAAVVPLTTAGYVLPLCTNVMATGLLVLKIWWMTRVPADVDHGLQRSHNLANRATAVIIESGLLYLFTQLVLVVLISIKHPAEAVVGVMAVQIYLSDLFSTYTNGPISKGIAPTLIVIRGALGINTKSTAKEVSHLVWAPNPKARKSTFGTTSTIPGNDTGESTRVLEPEVEKTKDAASSLDAA